MMCYSQKIVRAKLKKTDGGSSWAPSVDEEKMMREQENLVNNDEWWTIFMMVSFIVQIHLMDNCINL